MFKNRVRTAALAGAIAVATGVSGLTVPAYAQNPETGTTGSNPQTDNTTNVVDASKGNGGTEATNIAPIDGATAVDQLAKKVKADNKAIKDFQKDGGVVDYEPFADRPIEQQLIDDAKANEAKATELLLQATATLNDIDKTIKAVDAETKAANAAWQKYADAVTITKSEKQELIDFLDKGNNRDLVPDDIEKAIDELWALEKKPDDLGYLDQVQTIARKTDKGSVNYLVDQLDGSVRDYNSKDDKELANEVNAVLTISDMVNGYLTGFDNRNALYKDAVAKSKIATSRNVVELNSLAKQARAHVRALRVIQAYYGMAARWLDLYENDVLTTDEIQTLRADYYNVVFVDANGWSLYKRANAAASNIAKDNVNWDNYSNLNWENAAQKVRLLDKRYKGEAAAKDAADAARAAEAKDLNTQLAKVADELAKLNAAKSGGQNNPGNNNGGTTNPTTDTKSSIKFKNDDDSLAPAGIAAIVLGVVAALGGILAFAFPHVQNFLPKF
ncbi:hypothetical protein M5J20_08710 [Corynebacterium sp. TA-R-1]|uniref:Uncharacterized protein n=1 Tax=Corynebacterium stercoris TaxID=2943490 RepID=A0ABT1G5F3_9CORY|nr:hypothetical protein [Corynebacterium stercoris]MCP1388263.1 hypothetical protein [Corynebacterium stercoris]